MPHYQDDNVTAWHGDVLDVLAGFADNSIDAVVTDPPYGLEFMGRTWDTFGGTVQTGINEGMDRSHPFWDGSSRIRYGREGAAMPEFQAWCQLWATECLRVLKPGGHMLAFGGTRTFHRLACAVEDAGFEIRDSIAWIYGSGFPKSLDVSKQIDKLYPRLGQFTEFAAHYEERRKASSLTHAQVCALGDFYSTVNHGGASVNWAKGYNVPTAAQWAILQPALGLSDVWQPLIDRMETERQIIGLQRNAMSGWSMDGTTQFKDRDITAPATDAAKQWQGWGTALKPSWENVVVARKPLSGTVAQTVLEYGTGALNIDACRVASDEDTRRPFGTPSDHLNQLKNLPPGELNPGSALGRWPPNVLLDEAAAQEMDRQSGRMVSGANPTRRSSDKFRNTYGDFAGQEECVAHRGADSGGASRFFPVFRYAPKAPASERPTYTNSAASDDIYGARFGKRCTKCGRQVVNVPGSACECPQPDLQEDSSQKNRVAHPTVKPVELMRWLIRLVTPPHGTVLDPFAGTGTTGEAAIHEHMKAILIEREADYLPLIVARLRKPVQVGFDFDPDDG